jgi:16S rRNA processing protein RimM
MSQYSANNDQDICVGVITAVNGVKGYVKVRSFTNNPKDIAEFAKIFDENNNEYKLSIVTSKKDYVIVGIKGVTSRNEAERLRNIKLYIKRSELPEPGNDSYYHADLLGAEAVLSDGTKFGVVKNIVNFGAGDIIEIYDHNSEKTVYYPFTKQYVPDVNLKDKRVILEPLEEVIAASE